MSLEHLIGNTPLLELTNLDLKSGVKLFVKLEGQNPGGSVKDRAALGMIAGALERGDVKEALVPAPVESEPSILKENVPLPKSPRDLVSLWMGVNGTLIGRVVQAR